VQTHLNFFMQAGFGKVKRPLAKPTRNLRAAPAETGSKPVGIAAACSICSEIKMGMPGESHALSGSLHPIH